jgi:hypothetical protein
MVPVECAFLLRLLHRLRKYDETEFCHRIEDILIGSIKKPRENDMKETWYLLYNCYGLSIKSGTLEEMEEEKNKLLVDEQVEAGTDGRKLKFLTLVSKKEFMNLIGSLLP